MKKFLVLLLCLIWVAGAYGTIITNTYKQFDIIYYGAGDIWAEKGITNKVEWTAEQKADLRSSIDEWDRIINNTNTRQIKMHVFWDQLAPTTLGSSSSAMYYNPPQNTTIYTGSEGAWRDGDTGSPSWDTYIRYNNDFSWNFGADDPGVLEYDFRSVLTHELGHSLGWVSSYSLSSDEFSYGGNYGLTSFEKFFVDSAGNIPGVGTNGIPADFNELDNPIYFNGYNATNLYGGLVPIYAPDPYKSGSSLSHLDTGTFPDYVMSHAINNGVTKRTLSDLEIAMMDDMGWDVIPEPTTIVIIVGFGSIVYGVRRFFAV